MSPGEKMPGSTPTTAKEIIAPVVIPKSQPQSNADTHLEPLADQVMNVKTPGALQADEKGPAPETHPPGATPVKKT